MIPKLRRSLRQEKGLATRLGGRRVSGSGNQSEKGDVRTERWLIEAKQTTSPAYRLTLPVLRKIEREAILSGRLPVLIAEMAGRSYAVLDIETFEALKTIAESYWSQPSPGVIVTRGDNDGT